MQRPCPGPSLRSRLRSIKTGLHCSRRGRVAGHALTAVLSRTAAAAAWAQLAALDGSTPADGTPAGGNSSAPVTFLADSVNYDKTNNIVTAAGHVRAWQNGQTLYADKIVLDRNTDVVTASGNVVLSEPGGEDGLRQPCRALEGHEKCRDAGGGGKARAERPNDRQWRPALQWRYRAAFEKSSIPLATFAKPTRQSRRLWQIKASSATRDLQHKRVEYENAVMEIRRLSGLLLCPT